MNIKMFPLCFFQFVREGNLQPTVKEGRTRFLCWKV